MFRSSLFDDLFSIHRSLNQLIDRALYPSEESAQTSTKDVRWVPAIDCSVKGDQLVVRIFLPDVAQKDVSVSLTDNILVVNGERVSQEDKYSRVLLDELPYGKFERRITLPSEVLTDNDKMVARFVDGVLEISTPIITQYMQTRHIPIESAADNKQLAAAG